MSLISESYKNRLMELSGVFQNSLTESSRIDFLQKDFSDRVGRKYDKFLKFYDRGNWDKEKESDKFIKDVVSETIFKNGKIANKDMWVKFMMKQFEKFKNADPTENKEYLNWIMNIYLAGNLLDEDIYKINDYLTLFSKNKEKLPIEKRNVNSYNDLSSIYSAVSKFEKDEEMSASEKEKLIKLEGAEQIYDSENWKVIIPKTKDAACLYGKSTKWCTASDGSSNRFSYYHNQGPLFIMINKKIANDRDVNKKMQFHFESNQFMDAADNGVDVTRFFKSNPEMLSLFEKLRKIDAGFKIDHKLVSKKEGLEMLKGLNEKLSLIKRKHFDFFEDFYKEMGAMKEYVNTILNDEDFIKNIFYMGEFRSLMGSYIELKLTNEGLNSLKNAKWLNEWINAKETSAEKIQEFIVMLVKMGPEAKKFALELLKYKGVIWNSLLNPNKKGISSYFNMIAHSDTFGSKGVQMGKKMLNDKNINKELESSGISKITINMLRQFFERIPTKLDEYGVTSLHQFNNEARLYLKNILK